MEIKKGSGLFVPLPPGYRYGLILYVVLYKIWDPFFDFMMVGGDEIYGAYLAIDAVYSFLVFAPAMFYGHKYGWLHPLIFVPVFSLLKEIVADPGSIFRLFFVPESPFAYQVHNDALRGWYATDVLQGELIGSTLMLVGLLAYFVGFFWLGKFAKPKVIRLHEPKRVLIVCAGVMMTAFVIFFVYMEIRGGILTHINSIYSSGVSRFSNLKNVRALGVLVEMGTLAWLLWYALKPGMIKNPVFLALGLVGMIFNFISTGSRSSTVYVMIFLVAIWMLANRRAPVGRILVLGVVMLLSLTLLREVRMLAWHGDFTAQEYSQNVFESGLMGNLAKGSEEIMNRKARTDGYLAVVTNVAAGEPLLWGESYLHTVFAPIPRVLWEGKPRSIDAYVGERIFGYDGISIPARVEGEALYNFHVPGLIVVMVLFGMFHAWLARTYEMNSDYKIAPFLYFLFLFWFVPYSSSLTLFLHKFIPVVAMMFAMGMIRFRGVGVRG